MIKRALFFALILVVTTPAFSQKEKKVLFLLPFHTENAEKQMELKNVDDFYRNESFQMFGFWEGAKKALKEYEKDYVNLKIIVRDVCEDETKLQQILQEIEDENIDLIIGPMFSKPFAIAAEFAREHKIHIVNPFTNRTDFLNDNPYVFKLTPALSSRPEALNNLLLNKLQTYNLIFWTNGKKDTGDLPYYEIYFNEKGIPYSTVTIAEGANALKQKIKRGQPNVVLAFFENANVSIIQSLQTLDMSTEEIYLIAPESWMNIKNIDMTTFNNAHYHYFTNYFVDKKTDAVQLFDDEYVTEFSSYPSLERFSYQGYDVTNYFINLTINNFDLSKVKYAPISYDFEFPVGDHNANGLENKKQRLITIEDFQLKEVLPDEE